MSEDELKPFVEKYLKEKVLVEAQVLTDVSCYVDGTNCYIKYTTDDHYHEQTYINVWEMMFFLFNTKVAS
jgi:hypothetical protein